MIFECHVTCSIRDAEKAQKCADNLKWKTSQIDRDPALGDHVYFYLTCHDRTYQTMVLKLEAMRSALFVAGVAHVREKIEQVIYDTKTIKHYAGCITQHFGQDCHVAGN